MKNMLLALEMSSKKINDNSVENQEGMSIDEIYGLLIGLEHRIEEFLSENNESNEIPFNDQAKSLLRNLNESNIVSIGLGLDYNLELLEKKPIISQNNYPLLFKLICLPGERGEGVIKENHGMGYHIHYVIIHQKKESRTNIVMTFKSFQKDKEERHRLFWEDHGGGIVRHPDQFKNRRREAIYDTSSSFLNKISLKEFRSPKRSAQIVWPL